MVGVGTCTVTANQAGTANYQAAPGVPQTFTVGYPPLYGTLGIRSSPAGPIVTGSTVTVAYTLGNHTTTAQTLTLKVTLAFSSSPGSWHITIPSRISLNAGQTLTRTWSFGIAWWFPRGTYTLSETATDSSGDTTSSSATLIVS